eukprot:gnl/TRDRNA2_/TRDRNA2_131471_c0_seq2.p1 gnl/TRDRNA2_/TRDRNA2_131471_c0~~gnl/TRDRNA2_/TRDRNA2_131471_c0_seq2.p1  ORF type:complete len:672 (+),score=204.37 gnl/TRDRNA2_/TRDRNA2_131471_c0_seq2:107-2122(+)
MGCSGSQAAEVGKTPPRLPQGSADGFPRPSAASSAQPSSAKAAGADAAAEPARKRTDEDESDADVAIGRASAVHMARCARIENALKAEVRRLETEVWAGAQPTPLEQGISSCKALMAARMRVSKAVSTSCGGEEMRAALNALRATGQSEGCDGLESLVTEFISHEEAQLVLDLLKKALKDADRVSVELWLEHAKALSLEGITGATLEVPIRARLTELEARERRALDGHAPTAKTSADVQDDDPAEKLWRRALEAVESKDEVTLRGLINEAKDKGIDCSSIKLLLEEMRQRHGGSGGNDVGEERRQRRSRNRANNEPDGAAAPAPGASRPPAGVPQMPQRTAGEVPNTKRPIYLGARPSKAREKAEAEAAAKAAKEAAEAKERAAKEKAEAAAAAKAVKEAAKEAAAKEKVAAAAAAKAAKELEKAKRAAKEAAEKERAASARESKQRWQEEADRQRAEREEKQPWTCSSCGEPNKQSRNICNNCSKPRELQEAERAAKRAAQEAAEAERAAQEQEQKRRWKEEAEHARAERAAQEAAEAARAAKEAADAARAAEEAERKREEEERKRREQEEADEQRRRWKEEADRERAERDRQRQSKKQQEAEYLEVLGLPPGQVPSLQELKVAYRKAAMRAHPDRQENHERKEEATKEFQRVKAAFDYLTSVIEASSSG